MKSKGKSWMVGIVALYTTFALATIGFVFFAVGQNYDLVSKDYYEQEVGYQKQIDRMNRTNVTNAKCGVSADKQNIEIAIPDAAQASGKITLYRPSEADLDKQFDLALDASGQQKIPAASLSKGLWRMKMLWTANGQEYYKECEIFL